MKTFLTIIQCEFFKIKRTIIPWVILVAPLIYGFLIYKLLEQGASKLLSEDVNSWIALQQRFWPGLLMLFTPVFISLIIGVSHNLDTKNNLWKIFYTLPISKTVIYVSKSLFSLLVIFILFMLVSSVTLLIAFSMNAFTDLPEFSDHAYYFFEKVIPTALKAFSGSVLIWAIHNWLSYRIESFIVSIALALIGSVVVLIAIQGWKDIVHFPYAYPFLAISNKIDVDVPIALKGILYGSVVFILSILDNLYLNKNKS